MQRRPNTGSPEEEVRRLARSIEESSDALVLCRGAFDLRACLTGCDGPSLTRAALEAAVSAAASLGRRFLAGGDSAASAREAASEVLAALYDVARNDTCDRNVVRALLLAKPGGTLRTDTGLWPTLLGLARGDGVRDGCDLAFVHACELLAALAAGQPALCRALSGAGLLEIVSSRLLRATNGRRLVPTVGLQPTEPPEVEPMGDGWLFWATAAAWLLEVLLLEEDPALLPAGVPTAHRPIWDPGGQPRQSQVILDALVAALDRSLLRDRGCLVVQRLHVAGLRALGQLVRICRGQVFLSSGTHRSGKWQVEPAVRHLLASGAIGLAAQVLTLAGTTDEQGTGVALWFLAEVGEGAPTERELQVRQGYAEVSIAVLASRAISAYPKSRVVLREAQRVLKVCGAASGGGQAEGEQRRVAHRPSQPAIPSHRSRPGTTESGCAAPALVARCRPGSTFTESTGACVTPEPGSMGDWKSRGHEPMQVLPKLKPLLAPVLRTPRRPPSQTPRGAGAAAWHAWQPLEEDLGPWAARQEWCG